MDALADLRAFPSIEGLLKLNVLFHATESGYFLQTLKLLRVTGNANMFLYCPLINSYYIKTCPVSCIIGPLNKSGSVKIKRLNYEKTKMNK